MNAVQLQMINVSVKTLRAWINPCFTGWETAAVAAAFGADPIPASFEKSPRRTPCMTTAPNPPPANCSNPNAFVKNDSQPDTACPEDFMKCQGNGICLYRVEYKAEGDGNDDCEKNP